MIMSTNFSRKKKFVNKSLQIKIAFHLSIFFVLCATVVGIDYFIAQELRIAHSLASNIQNLAPDDALAMRSFFMLSGIYIIALLILNISFFYALSLYISHKIAGPIINISNKLDEIRQGDLNARVFLRKGDYLFEIETAINELANNLQLDFITLKNTLNPSHPVVDRYSTSKTKRNEDND
jgi:nitrogen fixation/metabolism regulation signal transduction histidine kinase